MKILDKNMCDFVIKEFKETGDCEINRENLLEIFDERFFLSQWGNKFRLVAATRHKRQRPIFKVAISNFDAFGLIKKLNLIEEKSTIFTSASTWRLT